MARFYDETVSENSLREADKKIRKKFLSNAIVLEDGEDRESAAGLGKSQAKKESKVVLDAPRKDTLVNRQYPGGFRWICTFYDSL